MAFVVTALRSEAAPAAVPPPPQRHPPAAVEANAGPGGLQGERGSSIIAAGGACLIPVAAVAALLQSRRAKRRAKRRIRGHIVLLASSTSTGTDPGQGDEEPEEQNPFQWVLGVISGVLGFLVSPVSESSPQAADAERATGAGVVPLVQQLGRSPIDAQEGLPIYSLGPFPKCTDASDLRKPGRHFTVVTTAALPWTTGPAINPLLRALYLARRGHPVILLMPWICREDQDALFPGDERFDAAAEQEKYILRWCRERGHIDTQKLPLELRWYEASYVEAVRSIFPKGDCSQELSDSPKDVLILEEPEHLCWYHNGQRWTELFRHVVGVVHTNYQVYLEKMNYEGLMGSATFRDSLFATFTAMVCSAYCDVTIKLSSAGISLPNEVKCNVHGVRQEFLDIGRRAGKRRMGGGREGSEAQVYFIGKAVMPKGWAQLMELVPRMPKAEAWSHLQVDAFGSGPDAEEISKRVAELAEKRDPLQPSMQMYPGIDHADKRFERYKVLVNPSTTEMLCTVTAEALAMGKCVVIPDHPSNSFFKANFADRCYLFKPEDAESFAKALQAALEAEGPSRLPAEAEAMLSWDAAIERLCDAAQVHVLSGRLSRPSKAPSSRVAYDLHKGFQNDTPALSDFLKGATMKKTMSWEDYVAPGLKFGDNSEMSERFKRFMRLQQQEIS